MSLRVDIILSKIALQCEKSYTMDEKEILLHQFLLLFIFFLLKSFYYCVKSTEIVTIMVKTGIILILFESDFSFLQNKLPHEKKKKGV